MTRLRTALPLVVLLGLSSFAVACEDPAGKPNDLIRDDILIRLTIDAPKK